jgi:hypothetical protein
MDTHEYLVPDEDLPGHGFLDSEFARSMLRKQEEEGHLVWDDDEQKYAISSRGMMLSIAHTIAEKSSEIEVDADPVDVITAIMECLPIQPGAVLVVDADSPEDIARASEEIARLNQANQVPDEIPDWMMDEAA